MEDPKKDRDSEIYINLEDKESASHSEVYENFYLNTATPKAGSEAASEGGQVRSGNLAAVCLALLCVLLLAVIIGLSVKHNAEKEQLQNSFDNLTMERDRLQSKLETLCPNGWSKFMSSCYYVSQLRDTWYQSEQDCISKEAGLVIINSREEQTFVSALASDFWIGLTNHDFIGQWKWVDGTLLQSGYWSSGHPQYGEVIYLYYTQNYCVQVSTGVTNTLQNWINVPCTDQHFWICEKIVQ